MNHDLVGIKDLLSIQKEKMQKIKYYTRIDNERYLREHPEIEFIIQNYIIKLLEDRPSNTLAYSGKYFHNTDFTTMWDEQQEAAEVEENLNK